MNLSMKSPDPKSPNDMDLMQNLKTFFNILLALISFLSRPSEGFIRSKFGERYFSVFPVIATAIIMNIWVFSGFGAATNPITGETITPLGVMIFSGLFVALSIYHRMIITIGNVKGNYEVYSYSAGYSWNIWYRIFKHESFLNRLFPFFVNRFVEPLFVLTLGAIIFFIDTAVGTFIQISAICLFIQEAISYRYKRMHYLDTKDAKLLAKYNTDIDDMFNQKKPASKDKSEVSHKVKPTTEGE